MGAARQEAHIGVGAAPSFLIEGGRGGSAAAMHVKDKAPVEMAPAAALAVKLAPGEAAGDADAFFSQFGLDRRCGFLALQQASLRLAPPYDAWEALAADLPALLTSGQLPLRVKAVRSLRRERAVAGLAKGSRPLRLVCSCPSLMRGP